MLTFNHVEILDSVFIDRQRIRPFSSHSLTTDKVYVSGSLSATASSNYSTLTAQERLMTSH